MISVLVSAYEEGRTLKKAIELCPIATADLDRDKIYIAGSTLRS